LNDTPVPDIKLIIFDWDDVFTIGSKQGYSACYHETLAGLGITLHPAEEKKRILAKWGQPHREELKELLREHPRLVEPACRLYKEKLFGHTFTDYLTLVPGTRDLLLRLKKKYVLCVATGMHPDILFTRIIPRFHIPDVFSKVISAYHITDPEKQKPHPYMVNTLLAYCNIQPDHALMVGDAESDVRMAHAAGVMPVVVLTGHLSYEQAVKLGVVHIIRDVTHLEDVLDRE
jgi:phosphoglycolate phosphatase